MSSLVDLFLEQVSDVAQKRFDELVDESVSRFHSLIDGLRPTETTREQAVEQIAEKRAKSEPTDDLISAQVQTLSEAFYPAVRGFNEVIQGLSKDFRDDTQTLSEEIHEEVEGIRSDMRKGVKDLTAAVKETKIMSSLSQEKAPVQKEKKTTTPSLIPQREKEDEVSEALRREISREESKEQRFKQQLVQSLRSSETRQKAHYASLRKDVKKVEKEVKRPWYVKLLRGAAGALLFLWLYDFIASVVKTLWNSVLEPLIIKPIVGYLDSKFPGLMDKYNALSETLSEIAVKVDSVLSTISDGTLDFISDTLVSIYNFLYSMFSKGKENAKQGNASYFEARAQGNASSFRFTKDDTYNLSQASIDKLYETYDPAVVNEFIAYGNQNRRYALKNAWTDPLSGAKLYSSPEVLFHLTTLNDPTGFTRSSAIGTRLFSKSADYKETYSDGEVRNLAATEYMRDVFSVNPKALDDLTAANNKEFYPSTAYETGMAAPSHRYSYPSSSTGPYHGITESDPTFYPSTENETGVGSAEVSTNTSLQQVTINQDIKNITVYNSQSPIDDRE